MEQLQQLLNPLLQMISVLFNPIILIPIIIIIFVLFKKNKEYKECAYYQITQLPYLSVKHNTGRYGEYLTYKYLKDFEAQGAKFLFNIYIPKNNGETTEIDVIMLCSKGLFVFESKNYSGWIFGSENKKNWYQTLPNGRGQSHKEQFYNPIMQNRSHIKHLEAFLGDHVPMRSVITFSDRCTLKSVQITSNDVSVINRYNVKAEVSAICNQIPNTLLTDQQIIEIYNKLYPYTQTNAIIKKQHISNIHNNLQSQSVVTQLNSQVQLKTKETVDDEKIKKISNGTDKDLSVEEKEKPIEESVAQSLKCPRCNASLVLRTATKGANAGKQFYGCSNYPKCKFIQNVDRYKK